MTTVPAIIAALRRLTAHLDPSDPSRKPGRRMGSTESPYSDDFEFNWDELETDIDLVTHALKGLVAE